MTLRDELVEYADRSSALIDDSPQMDEENTKRKVIEPLIELLGWDFLSPEVELEYSIQMGSGTKRVDYALKIDGTPVVFVEAKGCDVHVADDQFGAFLSDEGAKTSFADESPAGVNRFVPSGNCCRSPWH